MSNCPKCGAQSKCAMEEGKSFSACWCMGVKLTPAQLEDLDIKYSGQCLCENCLKNTAQSKLNILLKMRA
jgi:hypothetical protein